MRTIHKFPLADTLGAYAATLPRNADILCVQMQNNLPYLWAIVDDEAQPEFRRVVVTGTGWELPTDIGRGDYIGTYQAGNLVWHVFATKPNVLGAQP